MTIMKGPSEERQVPSVVNDSVYHPDVRYEVQSPQYYPYQSVNMNGNNSGANNCYPNEVPVQSVAPGGGFHYNYPAVEPSPTSPNTSNPFAEYTWMAEAEEFEKQVLEQMEQEEYLEACFQQMWEEEEGNEDEWIAPQGDAVPNQAEVLGINTLTLNDTQAPIMLNPNAAEFVPRWAITPQ